MLLGVEVATGAVSLGAARLWVGLTALFAGDGFVVSRARYVSGMWILLVGAAMLGTVLYAESARVAIEAGAGVCPRCGTETQRVRRRRRHRVLSLLLEANVTRRQCPKCGWRGLTV